MQEWPSIGLLSKPKALGTRAPTVSLEPVCLLWVSLLSASKLQQMLDPKSQNAFDRQSLDELPHPITPCQSRETDVFGIM